MRKKRVFVPAVLAIILLWLSGSTSFGDAIFEDVQGSAEVLSPPDGAIFYVQNPGDYVTVTATGESEISYTVTTDDAPLSVLHFYSITLNGRGDGDAVFHFQPNTTTVHSFATGPLTLTRDCGVGRHWVGVHQQAVNVTTSEIIGSVTDGYAFEVKVLPATATGGFQPLGVLPGYSHTRAYDISGDGSTVVGSCMITFASGMQAFRWKNGTMIGLGYLPGYYPDSMAFGVSADGSVVVGLSGFYPEEIDSRSCWAFRWKNGTMSALPAPVIPDYVTADCSARGVSADGSVVVGNVNGSESLYSHLSDACRWGPGGTITLLGSPWPYPYNNYARRVSGDGSVVVGFGSGGGFRWENGTIISLGSVGCNAGANGVSPDGSVVVGVGSGGGFRWENGTMTSLGQCTPYDVSADGSVIVGSGWDGKAFIWDANHGLRNLRDVLVNDYLMDLQGYPAEAFGKACGISDDGFTIVGGSWIARLDMGMITAVRGNVSISGLPANLYDRIRRLDEVEAGNDGYVRVRHPSDSEINMAPNSKMQVDGSPAKTKLELIYGKLRARLENLPPGALEIRTPQAVSSRRGTELVVETTVDESQIIVLEGQADVSTPNGSQTITLGQNQGIIVTAAGLGAPFPVDPDQIDRWWERAVDIGDFCGEGSDQPDGYVDYWDLLHFAQRWHSRLGDPGWDSRCDLDKEDNYVDYWDLLVFAQQWHKGQKP